METFFRDTKETFSDALGSLSLVIDKARNNIQTLDLNDFFISNFTRKCWNENHMTKDSVTPCRRYSHKFFQSLKRL